MYRGALLLTSFFINVNTFTLDKCCPQGYSVEKNAGFQHPSEFRQGNLHCKPDLDNLNWVPDEFKHAGELKVPLNGERGFLADCGEFGINVYNLRQSAYDTRVDASRVTEDGNVSLSVSYYDYPEVNVELAAGSYCVDAGYLYHNSLVVSCACPDHRCVQVCCSGYGLAARINEKGDLVCGETMTGESWDVGAAVTHIGPPGVEWVVADEKYWRHRCLHSSHPFKVEDEHAFKEQGVVVVRYHQLLTAANFTVNQDATLSVANEQVESAKYCLAPVLSDAGKFETHAFYCESPEFVATTQDVILQSWFAGVGAVFTLLTLLVHAILPEMRRGVKGISLMAHCTCMLVAYVALAIRPSVWSLYGEACLRLAYVLQFSFLSAFFWLNVRAVFIFTTFRSMDTMLTRMSHKNKESVVTHVLLCTLYACGVPALVCLVTWLAQPYSNHASRLFWRDGHVITEDTKEPPDWLIPPDLDDTSCWFATSLGRTLYYSLPMGLVLLVNLAMFVFTVWRLLKLTSGGGSLTCKKDDLRSDRRRLLLFAKMFVLMGLTWSGEFFSFANYLSQLYWYFSTVAMTFRAAAVFALFCCKRKVWTELREKLRCSRDRDVQYKEDPMNEITTTKHTIHESSKQ